MRFQNQTIWITGASSGIGASLAKAFSKEGASLILSGRRMEALEEVAKACAPAKCLILPFEATDFEALPDMISQAWDWQGHVDMLINNAGVSQRARAVDTEMSTYRQLFEIDVFAPIALTKEILPKMLARGRGHIATVSSVAGKIGAPGRTGYCAAKHALQGFFDALRAENARLGLRVTLITPGFIRTNIAKNALTGDGSKRGKSDSNIEAGMDPDKAAQVILNGMATGKEEIPVGEGREMFALKLKRFAPALLSRMTQKIGLDDGVEN